jgi:DNA repair protein RecO (recombination protein O)
MSLSTSAESAAFVLHTYPYRETSLIVESFTRAHGRIVLVAKGAKRPSSAIKGLLNPFQRLHMAWFGKSEMKTLKTAEFDRIYPQLSGAALMSAFYMNELMIKLAHREDPHEALFAAYDDTLAGLGEMVVRRDEDVRQIGALLRRFELNLLRELGYALQLEVEADTHEPVLMGSEYVYLSQKGPVSLQRYRHESHQADGLQLAGKTLLDMAANDFSDSVTLHQAKLLMRRAINDLLGDKMLHTRQLIRDMR